MEVSHERLRSRKRLISNEQTHLEVIAKSCPRSLVPVHLVPCGKVGVQAFVHQLIGEASGSRACIDETEKEASAGVLQLRLHR